jgi:hypothetical protein
MRLVYIVLLGLLALTLPAGAQDMMTPSVEVSDQLVLDGTVLVASAYSEGPGFIVIHADNGEGRPGPVIGHAGLNPGANYNIQVAINATQATPLLFAMLHADTGEVGVYEFGTVDGADGPVRDAAGSVITPPFNVHVISMTDQRVTALNTVVASTVVTQQDGFLVIHTDADGRPGPVAGVAPVRAGTTNNILIRLDMAEPTAVLWPMLHVDTGEAGVYEFGTVEGADGPVRVNDQVAVMPIWTVPHMRVADQIVVRGDGAEVAEDAVPTVTAQSVLADVEGWLVIHTEADGRPGPVAWIAPVRAGTNRDVVVTLDMAEPTAVLWPMLHVDTGERRVYEFGTVEGADGPVRVNDAVLTFPIQAAPSIVYEGTLDADSLTIQQALIDAPGWLVIHADNEGRPGPVLGYAPLRPGLNQNIDVALDPAAAGSQVFPMLHYDTGEAGVYEFGSVDGADGPVRVGDAVVVGPLALEPVVSAESGASATPHTAESHTMYTTGCMVSSRSGNVNLRQGPGTDFAIAGTLVSGDSLEAVGQAQGTDGQTWWNLAAGAWVRSDVVNEEGPCDTLPVMEAAAPAATEEAAS